MTSADSLYIFVHIPKCAGSSFGFYLKKQLEKSQLLAVSYTVMGPERRKNEILYTQRDLDEFLSRQSLEYRESLAAIAGHLCYYGMHSHFSRDCRYITFFRDPAERLYSHYLFLLRRHENGALLTPRLKQSLLNRHGHCIPFDEWIERADLAQNYVLKFMKGIPEAEDIDITEADLEKCKSELRNYYYIGLTEKYDVDAKFLFGKIGIPGGQVKRNVAEHKDEKALDNPRLMERIRANNALDYQLYSEAVKIRNLRRKALGLV